ncbi:hypothetical protein HKCCD6035_01075 [Rhodobacterales bacterium HKCCD6035]|nr:hypothetical protein [Rhodobacterales bacterium HKCCD6035]
MTRKRWLLAPVYSLLCSPCIGQLAHAGGLDQTTFSPLILFEDGGYAEISAQRRDITVSGALVAAPNVGAQNVLQNRTTLNLGYKQDLGDRMGVALQITTPYAANTAYNAVGYPLNGTTATLESRAITALLSYDIGQNALAYGGLRLLQSDGDIYVSLNAGLPNVFSYRFNGKSDTGLGYVLGLAYSRPEFGTRLALSYTSPIDLTFSGQEGRVLGVAGATPALSNTRFGVEMPATLSLDFQQGIATNTALFGRIQQSRWGGFEIRPNLYPAGALVTYRDDVMRYDLGVKHRLSEEWGISALYSQEPQTGGLSSNLAPVDGLRAFTLGAEYTRGGAAIGLALSEVRFDDTTTGLGTTPFARFNGNRARLVTIRLSHRF